MHKLESFLCINKTIGLTPLQAIGVFRDTYPAYKQAKIGVAGRLDPMATGVLPLLVGEENKNKAFYIGQNKIYKCRLLFGLDTDTHDQLGLCTPTQVLCLNDIEKKLADIAPTFIQTFKQTLPIFASKHVNGIPLFMHAKNGTLSLKNMPGAEVTISNLYIEKVGSVLGREILENIQKNIALVKGDFRQVAILERWHTTLKPILNTEFGYADITVACSTGTYIRALARDIGTKLSTGCFVYSLHRTQVGPWTLANCVPLKMENDYGGLNTKPV